MTLDEWAASVSSDLGVPAVEVATVLDLARDVAHGVARPAAPLTCLLVGLAVGAGADLATVVARVRALLPAS
jgi:hypothetical protein